MCRWAFFMLKRAVSVLSFLNRLTISSSIGWMATPFTLRWRHKRWFSRICLRLILSFILILGNLLLLLRKDWLENMVGFAELLYDLRSLLTIARRVVCWVHWIYDLELHIVVLRHWMGVVWPIDTINFQNVKFMFFMAHSQTRYLYLPFVHSVNTILFWVKVVAVKV
jgi:hypothetical protein